MEPPPPELVDVVARRATDQAQAGDWALVLEASGIPHRLEETADGWQIVVPGRDAAPALSALDAYDAETRERAAVELPAPDAGKTSAGIVVGVLLVAFFLFTGQARRGLSWFDLGSAVSSRILAGELWRAVTALTLHADLAHVVGNAVACFIFVTAVARWLGYGVGSLLVLLAGTAGNLVAAAYRGPGHVSVGASTATFGALGILAGLQFVRRHRVPHLRRRAWVAIGASLALLAMLGVSERSDVAAHFAGLACGTVVGLAAGGRQRPLSPGPQAALLLAAAAAVAGAWACAVLLAGGSR